MSSFYYQAMGLLEGSLNDELTELTTADGAAWPVRLTKSVARWLAKQGSERPKYFGVYPRSRRGKLAFLTIFALIEDATGFPEPGTFIVNGEYQYRMGRPQVAIRRNLAEDDKVSYLAVAMPEEKPQPHCRIKAVGVLSKDRLLLKSWESVGVAPPKKPAPKAVSA